MTTLTRDTVIDEAQLEHLRRRTRQHVTRATRRTQALSTLERLCKHLPKQYREQAREALAILNENEKAKTA